VRCAGCGEALLTTDVVVVVYARDPDAPGSGPTTAVVGAGEPPRHPDLVEEAWHERCHAWEEQR
jgi:hypothetical protein